MGRVPEEGVETDVVIAEDQRECDASRTPTSVLLILYFEDCLLLCVKVIPTLKKKKKNKKNREPTKAPLSLKVGPERFFYAWILYKCI